MTDCTVEFNTTQELAFRYEAERGAFIYCPARIAPRQWAVSLRITPDEAALIRDGANPHSVLLDGKRYWLAVVPWQPEGKGKG